MTFEQAFWDEMSKLAMTSERGGILQKIKDVAKSRPLGGITELSRSPILRGIKAVREGMGTTTIKAPPKKKSKVLSGTKS